MNNVSRVLAALAAAGLVLIAALAGASLGSRSAQNSPQKPETAQAPIGSASLYQLSSRWTTDGNQAILLQSLRGQVQVVAMIFTRCPSACPTLVKEIKSLAAHVPRKAAASTHYVLVSIDPDYDTPEVLARYREEMGLDAASWTLLRGTDEAVRELAAVIGVSYGKREGMEIAHTKLITVLDREGQIVHQQTGVQDDPDRIIAAITEATKKGID